MELCLAGLFFLVRDADNRATCTAQATIMILVTALTALFHYTIDCSNWIRWLPLPAVVKQKINRISSHGKDQPKISELSTAKSRRVVIQDEALKASRPVVWIPKDDLGISDDEISHVRSTYDNMWISNEGASLDERGKLKPWGQPPDSSR